MQQRAHSGLSTNKPQQTDFTISNEAVPSISSRKLQSAMFMQQAAPSRLAPRKPLSNSPLTAESFLNSVSPSLEPRKPMAIDPASNSARNSTRMRLAPQKPITTGSNDDSNLFSNFIPPYPVQQPLQLQQLLTQQLQPQQQLPQQLQPQQLQPPQLLQQLQPQQQLPQQLQPPQLLQQPQLQQPLPSQIQPLALQQLLQQQQQLQLQLQLQQQPQQPQIQQVALPLQLQFQQLQQLQEQQQQQQQLLQLQLQQQPQIQQVALPLQLQFQQLQQQQISRLAPRKLINTDSDFFGDVIHPGQLQQQQQPVIQQQQHWNFLQKSIIVDEMDPVIPTLDPLYTQLSSLRDGMGDFIIDRPEQLQNIQQTKFISSVMEIEPTELSELMEIEEYYTTKIPLNPRESFRPTYEIDHEIEQLSEIYKSGFISHAVYERRLTELTVEKKYSKVVTVPHVDHGFTNTRRTQPSSSKNRNVRIFISSTFRDMSEEREILLKQVFPKLREFCKSRGVFLTVVDLRWGITATETERGDTIGICLKEVDRCRPYFLCMLGHRYGWAQPLDPRAPRDPLLHKTFSSATPEFPWITKYSDRSVTELEIRHAVLNNPQSDTARWALFYVKNEPGMKDDDPRLTKLKDEIDLSTNLSTKKYSEPMKFAELVFEQVREILSEDFPVKDMPTPLERERMAHAAFQESRASVYIGRQYYFDTINAHIAKPNAGPMVIIGSSGSGKSALVCNWTAQYRDTHPTELVIPHYIGSTAASTDLGRMLQRILQEINLYYDMGKEKEIPQEYKELAEAFPKWLAEASRRGGLVLVLDALNQLDPRHNALDLAWLPRVLPPDVKLIVSTLPGRTQEVLTARGWSSLLVQPLTTSERLTLIQEYLSIYGKKLTDAQLDLIVNSPQCQNPLFLRTLLEEIRVFGVFEQLTERINHYLTALTPPQLFELVFKRLEEDYQTEAHPRLVGDVLASLWVSRRGLTEAELVDLLNLPHTVWSPLFLALSEAVVSKSGFLTFFHDFMRQAVELKYLKRNNAYTSYRTRLIDYFQSDKCKDDQRRYEEIPYLMENSAQWQSLCTFISQIDNFKALFEKEHRFDLYRYWRSVSSENLDPDASLIKAISQLSESDKEKMEVWSKATTFLQDIGRYENAEHCARQALACAESMPKDNKILALRWQELAYILRLRGKYTEAAPLYEKALEINEAQPDINQQVLAQSINSLAILYRMQGKYDKAEPLYLRALKIRRAIFGDVHEDIAQSFNSLGCLYQDMGRYAISENYLQQAIAQREQLLGSNHPDVAMSLNNLGGLYIDWSKYTHAEPIYIRAMLIYQNVFGQEHPHVAKSLNSLAGLYQEQGKYSQAEEMYHKCITMKRKLLGSSHPDLALTLNDFAVLYARQDKYPQAEALYTEALKIRSEVFGTRHPDYAQSIKNIASLYQDMRLYDKALPLFQQSSNISIDIFGPKHQDVASSYVTLAGCLQLMGKYDDAVPYYEKALHILQELLGSNHADVALALNDMAVLFFRKKDYKKAEELYLRALKTYENVFGTVHPHTGQAFVNVAQFYRNTGVMDKAVKFYKQGVEIFVSQYGPDDPKTIKIMQEAAALSG